MKVIAVNGKVLLANGKAVKPPEVAADNFVNTTCEVAGNNNVSSNWSPSVTAEEYISPKYSYNSVVLPEIPADVLAQYPYAWIRLGSDGKTYDLILSSYSWYFTDKLLTQSSKYVWYTATIEAGCWVYKTTYTDIGGFNLGGGLIWSNHDIPNGSATATEIYFEGSEPVLAE